MNNGYKYIFTLKCIECGVAFEWSVPPTQLLNAKTTGRAVAHRADARNAS